METANPIRILFVEDAPLDAEMAVRELQKNGIQFTSARVDTKTAFLQALSEFRPDIIISDYRMPEFDGMQALKLAKEQDKTLPFILFTGSLNEETAVECIKSGASDYVIKEHIKRLSFAVQEALVRRTFQTEKEAAVRALQESEARFRRLYEQAPIPYQALDGNGNILSVNNAWLKELGYERDEVIGKWFGDFLTGDGPEMFSKQYPLFKTSGACSGVDFEMKRKDGDTITVYFEGSIAHNEKGEFLQTHCVFTNITERKRTETALRENEAFIKAVLDNLPIGVAVNSVSPAVTFTYMNDNFPRIYRTTREKLSDPDAFWSAVYEDHEFREEIRKKILEDCASKNPQCMYWVDIPITRQGEETSYITAKNIQVPDKELMISTVWDVTDRKRAEAALRESEEQFRVMFEMASIGIAQADPNTGKFLRVNQKMCAITGYSAEELLQMNVPDLTYPEDRQKNLEAFQRLLHGEMPDYHMEKRYVRKDGKLVWVNVNMVILRDETGHPVRTVATIEDITERKMLENQLLQAQKMEAVGQLAGGIAHDFNNILTAVIGYGYMLQLKLKEDNSLRTYADNILSLSEKAAHLTQSLLAFSRKQVMHPRAVNLNEVIRTVEKLLFRIIGEDIQLKTNLSAEEMIIMADHVQIEQVLMNLATNARDAMPQGGLLTIDTDQIDMEREFIRGHGYGKEGSYAVISVTDSGAGIDKETQDKIFEPFFTTKEAGKGTGLGLSMVYGIIKQHDGYINVYSEPGKGTTFRIYLPLIEATAEKMKPLNIKPLETGTETILLAEDEPEVRVFNKKLLEEYGYRVIEAMDGDDAIGKFKLHKDKIHLVILDVIMPNRNGREVYEAIRKITPDVRVIFTSGYPAEHINGMITEGFEYIPKPVAPTKLLEKIREVLEK